MRTLLKPLRRYFRGTVPARKKGRGQTLVEYSLVLAVLSILALSVFAELGARVVLIFSGIDSILDTAQGS